METLNIHHQDIEMITSETPYKLAEIIRDTWPGLYRSEKETYSTKKFLGKFQKTPLDKFPEVE